MFFNFPALFSQNITKKLSEPRLEDWQNDVEERIQHGVDLGKKSGFIKTGQPIVCITGWRKGAGSSNTIRIV